MSCDVHTGDESGCVKCFESLMIDYEMAQERQLDRIADAFRDMKPEERKHSLDELATFMCLLCGQDAPCYCAPCYDE